MCMRGDAGGVMGESSLFFLGVGGGVVGRESC